MDTVLAQLLTGAVGGAVVSSIIGPYISQGKERRRARAEALNALVHVETARWADKDSTLLTFRQTVGAFKAAALVAGVDNTVADFYTRLAATARDLSQADFDDTSEDNPFAGGIPTDISDLVRDAAELVVVCIRRPWRSRLQRARSIATLLDQKSRLQKRYAKRNEPVNWDIPDF